MALLSIPRFTVHRLYDPSGSVRYPQLLRVKAEINLGPRPWRYLRLAVLSHNGALRRAAIRELWERSRKAPRQDDLLAL